MHQFSENLQALLGAKPVAERDTLIGRILGPVNTALSPVFGGQNFDTDQAAAFQEAVDDAWGEALYEAGRDGDEALANG